jgi:hypothetical protein
MSDIDENDILEEDYTQQSSNNRKSKSSGTNATEKMTPILPTRAGFLPKPIFDDEVSATVNLVQEYVLRHNTANSTLQNHLFESVYSLFAVLAFEALNTEFARTSTFEACKLLAVQFEDVSKTFYRKDYFISSFLEYFPAQVLPEFILNSLKDIKLKDGLPIPLNAKYKKLSEKAEYKTEEKILEITVANLGDKALFYIY